MTRGLNRDVIGILADIARAQGSEENGSFKVQGYARCAEDRYESACISTIRLMVRSNGFCN